jgi:hypothetical protein
LRSGVCVEADAGPTELGMTFADLVGDGMTLMVDSIDLAGEIFERPAGSSVGSAVAGCGDLDPFICCEGRVLDYGINAEAKAAAGSVLWWLDTP